MLLQVRHLGETGNENRLYHCQTHTGMDAIVKLDYADLEIDLVLVGTCYRRTYPASGHVTGAPRIADLEGGYQTVSTFLQTWEHSTPEQKEILQEYEDRPISWARFDTKKGRHVRTRRKLRLAEDRPRAVPARSGADGWARVYAKELRAALKGTLQADNIRIEGVTIRRSILWGTKAKPGLLDTSASAKGALTRDPVIELRCVDGDTSGGALELRSADGRARVTVKHGAGDKHKGRHGWSRRIVLQPA